jgi:hypothetical protein
MMRAEGLGSGKGKWRMEKGRGKEGREVGKRKEGNIPR